MSGDRNLKIVSLLRIVTEYQDLQDNWDTYGGKPACDKAVGFAVKVLKALIVATDIPIPIVSPISTGVFLDWHLGDYDGVYFEVDNESVFTARHGEGPCLSYEDPTFSVARALEFLKGAIRWK